MTEIQLHSLVLTTLAQMRYIYCIDVCQKPMHVCTFFGEISTLNQNTKILIFQQGLCLQVILDTDEFGLGIM